MSRTAQVYVGTSVARVDAVEKTRGDAAYLGDLVVPGMLHGAVVRSPVAHARLGPIDTAAAEAAPGVHCVVTAADLQGLDPFYGHAIRDRPVLAIDRVRFAGEPVAIVVADTLDQAEDAGWLLGIDYEPLPIAGDVASALAEGAPQIHDGELRAAGFHALGELPAREGNVCYRYEWKDGDAFRAFAGADIVVEGEYTFPAVYQYPMESHGSIAQVDGDRIDLWSTAQHPFLVRSEIAELFGVSLQDVRVQVPLLGGGFGAKSYTRMEPIAVAAARKAGRPVRIVNRVDESMATTRRHGMRCRMQTAARADGTLLGRRCTIELDTGAYADNGPRVTATAGDAAAGAYRWSAIDVEALCVYTNTSPSGSYRAFGACHLQWISELQVDEVARRAGLGAVEIRRRNLLAPGEEIRRGAKPLDADLVGDVEKVAAAIGIDRPREPYTGVGLSVGLLAAGSQPVSVALARLEADGGALILFSSNEVGQGSRTVFTQIAAEELALAPERIRVHPVDTLTTPYDRSTGASRSTTLGGLALQRACQQVRDRLKGIASEATGLPPEAFEARDGALHHEDESWTYASLVHRHFGMAGGELIGVGEVRPEGGDDGSFRHGPVFWEVCVAAARVRVDPDTGLVRVLGTATAADVGRAINPSLVEVQDEGGGLQGLGNALFEEMVFVEGELVNNNLLEYRVPTFDDMPGESACVIVENADGPGPYGAKGVGEGAQAAVAAAIATALADAGVPMRELPLTPDRVWRRMRELEAEGRWPRPTTTTDDERGVRREERTA